MIEPVEGETPEDTMAREARVTAELNRMQRQAGRTRPDLGEPVIATGAPNPWGDPRKPQDRHAAG